MAKKLTFTLLFTILLLTGVFTPAQAGVTVNGEKDTITGEATILIPKLIAKNPKLNMLPAFTESETVKVEQITKNDLQGVKLTFNETPFEAFGGVSTPIAANDEEVTAPPLLTTNSPFKLTHEGDEFILSGDFTGYFLTASDLKAKGVKLKKKQKVSAPVIDFSTTLPVDFTVVPDNLKEMVDGKTLKLTTAELKTNPKFEVRADATAVPRVPEISIEPSLNPPYPLQEYPRNQIPIYFFTFTLLAGAGLILYGYFGSGDAAAKFLKNKKLKGSSAKAPKTQTTKKSRKKK